jgi:DNA-binding transcriptional regulator GbsR (MarR family)
MTTALPPAMRRLIDFLGELGPRWGLPAEPCRVHGYLYLTARPIETQQITRALGMSAAAVESALQWLVEYRLVERDASGAWRTQSDPWELMMRALEERRQRELGPALALLRECQGNASGETDRVATLQIGKLVALVEDLAAIDMQARRLSPQMLRQMIGVGGIAARVIGRTFGDRGKS